MEKHKGNVVIYSDVAKAGLVAMPDGSRFTFLERDWKGEFPPERGDAIEFKISGNAATLVDKIV